MSKKIDPTKLKLLPVPEGFKVRYEHCFPSKKDKEGTTIGGDILHEKARLKANGTKDKPPKYHTKAELIDSTTKEPVVVEYSYCNPKDSPSRKLGRVIAHNRLIKKFHNSVI